jgi:hypothetical protein
VRAWQALSRSLEGLFYRSTCMLSVEAGELSLAEIEEAFAALTAKRVISRDPPALP